MELRPQIGSPAAKRDFVKLLAPLAPHLAEELWHQLGEPFSVHTQPWPVAQPETSEAVEISVQVDGRLQGRIVIPQGASQAQVVEIACREVDAALAGAVRVIYVPGRIISFVT
jgi:leucyl-tRNA synthetase